MSEYRDIFHLYSIKDYQDIEFLVPLCLYNIIFLIGALSEI